MAGVVSDNTHRATAGKSSVLISALSSLAAAASSDAKNQQL